MKAAVFVRSGVISLVDKPIPVVGPGSVVLKITTTTIRGTDVHILKGEYPVDAGRTIGHEPVGVISEIGAGVEGYTVGQRVAPICCASWDQIVGLLVPDIGLNASFAPVDALPGRLAFVS